MSGRPAPVGTRRVWQGSIFERTPDRRGDVYRWKYVGRDNPPKRENGEVWSVPSGHRFIKVDGKTIRIRTQKWAEGDVWTVPSGATFTKLAGKIIRAPSPLKVSRRREVAPHEGEIITLLSGHLYQRLDRQWVPIRLVNECEKR
jgi:hypothetical protein